MYILSAIYIKNSITPLYFVKKNFSNATNPLDL